MASGRLVQRSPTGSQGGRVSSGTGRALQGGLGFFGLFRFGSVLYTHVHYYARSDRYCPGQELGQWPITFSSSATAFRGQLRMLLAAANQ